MVDQTKWWAHRDRCRKKFEFDDRICTHNNTLTGNCNLYSCPTFSRGSVMEKPMQWDTRLMVTRNEGKTHFIYHEKREANLTLSKLIDSLIKPASGKLMKAQIKREETNLWP